MMSSPSWVGPILVLFSCRPHLSNTTGCSGKTVKGKWKNHNSRCRFFIISKKKKKENSSQVAKVSSISTQFWWEIKLDFIEDMLSYQLLFIFFLVFYAPKKKQTINIPNFSSRCLIYIYRFYGNWKKAKKKKKKKLQEAAKLGFQFATLCDTST